MLEQGEEAKKRQKTVDAFWKDGLLDPDSNVQFGEGGAGAFSDGKLNTLVKDTFGRNKEVFLRLTESGGAKGNPLREQTASWNGHAHPHCADSAEAD